MITNTNKAQCCGSSACIEICPAKCISFKRDAEGFLYPYANQEACTSCHLCEMACPFLNPTKEKLPIKTFAAINNNDEIRKKSSSGGLFYLFAKKIIDEGGVVFGARFNEQWEVVMDYTETLEGIHAFMGSKYVQANPQNTYAEVKKFLKEGRKVLYSGTGCQISGLRHFLRRNYNNLYLVDVICHGTPSPTFWKKYVSEFETNRKSIIMFRKSRPTVMSIFFRDKSNGWKKFRFVIHLAKKSAEDKGKIYSRPFYEDPYFSLFLKNYTLRPSCYQCPAKKGRCESDITIGDLWGIENIMPQIDDDMGVSACLINTNKGLNLTEGLNMRTYPVSYKDILKRNHYLEDSVKMPPNRNYVFSHLRYSTEKLERIITKGTTKARFLRKMKQLIKNGSRFIIGERLLKIVKTIISYNK